MDRLRGGCRQRLTLGADKSYDARDFVAGLRARRATPHVAQDDRPTKTGRRRRPSTDARTARHPGHASGRIARKRIEEVFGWVEAVATLRQTRHRGLPRVAWSFTPAAAAYNLVRLTRPLRPAT